MAAARSTGTGLGDMNLDTSGGGLGSGGTDELAGGVIDPWARFAEQLSWDELRATETALDRDSALPAFGQSGLPTLAPAPSAFAPAPALPSWAPELTQPAFTPEAALPFLAPEPGRPAFAPEPMRPYSLAPPLAEDLAAPGGAPVVVPAPVMPPLPAMIPVVVRSPAPAELPEAASVAVPDLVARRDAAPTGLSSPAVELPTGPSLRAKPAAGPREQWRARAQELGLRSVFITAADDFGKAVAPAINPAPLAPTPALPQMDRSVSMEASRPQSPALAPQPEPAGNRLLGASRPGGSLFRTLQRPTAAPPAAPPPPAPAPTSHAPPPPLSSLLAADAVQFVRQCLQRGKTLLQQLLPGRPS